MTSATIDTAAVIRERLAALSPDSLELLDESAAHAGHAGALSGGHYRLAIVSPRFAGKSRVERHRLIYGTLGSLAQLHIHALAIDAYAPGEL